MSEDRYLNFCSKTVRFVQRSPLFLTKPESFPPPRDSLYGPEGRTSLHHQSQMICICVSVSCCILSALSPTPFEVKKAPARYNNLITLSTHPIKQKGQAPEASQPASQWQTVVMLCNSSPAPKIMFSKDLTLSMLPATQSAAHISRCPKRNMATSPYRRPKLRCL